MVVLVVGIGVGVALFAVGSGDNDIEGQAETAETADDTGFESQDPESGNEANPPTPAPTLSPTPTAEPTLEPTPTPQLVYAISRETAVAANQCFRAWHAARLDGVVNGAFYMSDVTEAESACELAQVEPSHRCNRHSD